MKGGRGAAPKWKATLRPLGARVIGTVGSEKKAALARENGCAHPIVYTWEDIVARVREITGGDGLLSSMTEWAPRPSSSPAQPAAARHARLLRAEMLDRAQDLFDTMQTGAVRASVRQRYPRG